MTNIDDIPSHFINKAGIANRLDISRVTVDRMLTKIAKDPILHGRLKVHIVSEGKRTLYFYDPSDVDAVFGELQRTSRGRSKTVRSINRKVTTTSTSQSNALLEKDVQHLQSLQAKLESEVADLKDQRDKKDRQIEFLQAQLTDQRPNSASTSPEATEEAVVPPVKPTSETDYTDPYQPDTSIIEEEKRIYFEKTGKDIPPIRTQKDYDEFRKIVGSEYEIMHGLDQTKAKDAEPEAQPELPPIEDKQPTEAPKEKEARRDNIAPKAEPQQYEKPKGLWAWLKGY